jgi:hypothetical protein
MATLIRKSFTFWMLSPLLGLALSYLFAIVGLAELAALALFGAAGGVLVAVAAIFIRSNMTIAGRILIALTYMGGAVVVLFFGGWGAMMIAGGG